MSYVLNYLECPNCKSEQCFEDYNCHSGETFMSCPECGYLRSELYKRDDNGEYVKIDETKEDTWDNHILEVKEIENPYGSFKISEKDRAGYSCGSLENKEQYDGLVEDILTTKDGQITSCVISRFVDGKIVKETII